MRHFLRYLFQHPLLKTTFLQAEKTREILRIKTFYLSLLEFIDTVRAVFLFTNKTNDIFISAYEFISSSFSKRAKTM